MFILLKRGGSLQLFDLHCDSIVNYKKEQSDFLCGKTQFSLKEIDKFNRLCQTMAVVRRRILNGLLWKADVR